VVGIAKDGFCDDFFQELAAAFKEGDGAIGFGKRVVGFGWLGNDNYKGVRPRVMAKGNGGVEKGKKAIRSRFEGPFQQLVIDTR